MQFPSVFFLNKYIWGKFACFVVFRKLFMFFGGSVVKWTSFLLFFFLNKYIWCKFACFVVFGKLFMCFCGFVVKWISFQAHSCRVRAFSAAKSDRVPLPKKYVSLVNCYSHFIIAGINFYDEYEFHVVWLLMVYG